MSVDRKKAFLTGITGQDGSYLCELLLKKGYEVHAIKRRASSINTDRIDHLYNNKNLHLYYGDLTDSSSLTSVLQTCKPDEIYNMGAMSHVRTSFDIPEYTGDTVGLGTVRLLSAVHLLHIEKEVRFYQASSSEMFGRVQETPQNERTPFYPCSPYACSKVYAHWTTINYREMYNMHASCGILFNHESPRRGETFVTRKVVQGAVRIAAKKQGILYLGNLEAVRDWGHAKDYMEAVWLMLQQDKPDDYVLATGHTHTVRELCEYTFAQLGMEIEWQGQDLDEKGFDKKTGKQLIGIQEVYYRPVEVDYLKGDAAKAREKLGWDPHYDFYKLIDEMVEFEKRAVGLT